ncbi:unnamed protein product [Calicophoron daubneyi]|uniref:Uridylate-specific endoribonuclease n=1 Tax=Calicophoron daubneyi TaxID=300641 RepID=A0AAV2TN90_CALDB
MDPRQTIPRGLPPVLHDELSMLFSDYFVRSIRNDAIYLEMNRVNWDNFQVRAAERLPLLPPHITPQRLFNTEFAVATRNILLHWEDGDKGALISQFLSGLYATSLFGEVYERLYARGVFGGQLSDFQAIFRRVWFGEYTWDQMNPDNSPRTCGFQHVYIGEMRNNIVKGLHHWVRYYILEKSGRLVTQAVLKKHPELHIASLEFSVDNCVKPYGTIFFGIPIHFEIMIFFCAFLIGSSRDIHFLIDGSQTTIVCYDVATRSDRLATAFFKY